jgi:hypothetical protein
MPKFTALGFAGLRKSPFAPGMPLIYQHSDLDRILCETIVMATPFLARRGGVPGAPDSVLASDGKCLIICDVLAGREAPAVEVASDGSLRGLKVAREYWKVRARVERRMKAGEVRA